MLLGYNTNGLTDVDAVQAIDLVHSVGYRGIALTLDRGLLNPFAADVDQLLRRTADRLQQLGMRSVVETGARFLLDPEVKHEPTLVTADPAGRAQRVDFLCRAVDAAAELGSDCVSLWSGTVRDGAGDREAMDRLADGLAEVLDFADQKKVPLAFEPEPGMFIDTITRFAELHARVDHPSFGLTLDVGHVHCLDDGRIEDHLSAWSPRLFNVHLEDMKRGTHEHLMLGEGEIHFPPIFAALRRIDYPSGVHVELSRHSHDAVETARRAFDFLTNLGSA
jgi:sugar phosphate isomerase/epimerase